MRGIVSYLQKKRSTPGNDSQTPPRPAQRLGNLSYIFFLSHLCCRGHHNSIGARRYTLFVAGHSKFRDPSQIRSHLSQLLANTKNIQIAKLRVGRTPGCDAVQTSYLDKSWGVCVALDFWYRSDHHSTISDHQSTRESMEIEEIQ